MASICFADVSKRYEDGTLAVDGLDLDVADGGFTVLVGPSGCGKSTALRMLAGLEDITSGEVRIADRVVNDVPPKDRDIAMVFQSYALYPHMTVAENMGFSLKMHGVDRAQIRARVEQAAEMLGLTDLLDKRPRQLSGGQRQRVALGRSIVREPRAFLMDEPLSNLDAKMRVEMRGYLQGLHADLGVTTVYVTHDQTEAMTMGDRVAVMRDGRLEQVDAPQALYEQPANVFVAGFIGSPAMNLVRGHVQDGVVHLGSHRLRVPAHRAAAVEGRDVVVGIRPESMSAAGGATPEDEILRLPVVLSEALGHDVLVHTELDAEAVLTGDMEAVARELGGVEAGVSAGHTRLTARLPASTRMRPGDVAPLAVAIDELHFFDAATEQAIR
jgi:multiple sugar transport system ATP-binding protein